VQGEVIQSLFFVLVLALVGGFAARLVKIPVLVGYLVVGILGSLFFSQDGIVVELSEIGMILLLFSVGLELSLSKLSRVGGVAVVGAIFQMLIVGSISFLFLILLGFETNVSLVLSSGFSLSSTAVVVKMLEERAETESIHGEIMVGWLLTQDLAVVPIISLIPVLLAEGGGGSWLSVAGSSLLISTFILSSVFFLGRLVAPFLIHTIASSNSRELMVLGGVSLALGTAYLVSSFGISAALGAFLAGVVLSETQENHAVLAETRPLRDLFVILFFVTLGIMVTPSFLISHLFVILGLVVFVLVLKFVVVYLVMLLLGYRGKVVLATSLGLSEIGEFSFVILMLGREVGILNAETTSLGVSVALITLLISPFLFKSTGVVWRRVKKLSKLIGLEGLLVGKRNVFRVEGEGKYKNHVIICGYGRMGRWVGNALEEIGAPFVVVDYSQKVIHEARMRGIPVVYGDPAEPSVLVEAGLTRARALIVAIPDRITQEEVVAYCQTVAPTLKVFARAHLDEDVKRLSRLKVERVVQPEFEASLSVVKDVLRLMGKDKDEVSKELKKLKRLHTVSL